MYATKLIPAYCRLCLKTKMCPFNFKFEIKNNGFHNECPQFVLQVGKLSTEQYNRFDNYYEQHQNWCRELELDFVKNLVNSPGYR